MVHQDLPLTEHCNASMGRACVSQGRVEGKLDSITTCRLSVKTVGSEELWDGRIREGFKKQRAH
jgi:hypothetical protein